MFVDTIFGRVEVTAPIGAEFEWVWNDFSNPQNNGGLFGKGVLERYNVTEDSLICRGDNGIAVRVWHTGLVWTGEVI